MGQVDDEPNGRPGAFFGYFSDVAQKAYSSVRIGGALAPILWFSVTLGAFFIVPGVVLLALPQTLTRTIIGCGLVAIGALPPVWLFASWYGHFARNDPRRLHTEHQQRIETSLALASQDGRIPSDELLKHAMNPRGMPMLPSSKRETVE